jgi:hypothetical protein
VGGNLGSKFAIWTPLAGIVDRFEPASDVI